MIKLPDGEIRAANERGRIFRETHPHALAQDLRDATPEQLCEIEVSPYGFGLHWPQIEADFTVAGLMNGVFGTAKWMAARAGRSKSAAKAAAARANGKKGGRPRKAG